MPASGRGGRRKRHRSKLIRYIEDDITGRDPDDAYDFNRAIDRFGAAINSAASSGAELAAQTFRYAAYPSERAEIREGWREERAKADAKLRETFYTEKGRRKLASSALDFMGAAIQLTDNYATLFAAGLLCRDHPEALPAADFVSRVLTDAVIDPFLGGGFIYASKRLKGETDAEFGEVVLDVFFSDSITSVLFDVFASGAEAILAGAGVESHAIPYAMQFIGSAAGAVSSRIAVRYHMTERAGEFLERRVGRPERKYLKAGPSYEKRGRYDG